MIEPMHARAACLRFRTRLFSELPMFRPASARSVVPHVCALGFLLAVCPASAQPRLVPPLNAPADDDFVEERPQILEPETLPRPIAPVPVNPQPVNPRPVLTRPRPHSTLRIAESGNANLQLVLPERIVNQILGVGRTETEPVRDCILGANVLGEQTAVTSLAIDFHPNPTGIHATMRLQGTVNTQTVGRTTQADISTMGHHQVFAAKEIYFDGSLFSTRPAVVHTQVRSTNVGASTRFDGVPLLNGFARSMAVNVANSRQRESEPIIWQRVSSQVYRKFNGQVDRQLADANQSLNGDLRPRLRTLSFLPDRESVSTTDTHLTYTALLRDGMVPSTVPPADLSDSAITVRVHDSLLHQAIDSLQLNGKKLKQGELTALVQRLVTTLGGRVIKEDGAEPAPSVADPDIVFAENQAIQCEFAEEALVVTMVARFDALFRSIVPEQRIRIRFRTEFVGDEVLLRRESVELESVEESSPQIQQMYVNLVRPRVEASVADIAFPRDRTLPAPVSRALRIERIDSQANWLTIQIGLR